MSDPMQDRDLRDLFQRLRAEDRPTAPDFGRMMDRAREEAGGAGRLARDGIHTFPRSRAWGLVRKTRSSVEAWARLHRRWAWTGGLAAAAVVTALLLTGPPARTDADFERVVGDYAADPAMGAWTSPTDGLLQVPGMEFLRTVPKVGSLRLPGGQARAPETNQL